MARKKKHLKGRTGGVSKLEFQENSISGKEINQFRIDENRIKNYFDLAGVILLIIDSDQKVSLINKKGAKILGLSKEEIIGKNWFKNFVPEAIRKETLAVFKNLIKGKGEIKEYFENPVKSRGREDRIIAWHNTVLRDEEGKIIGTLSTGTDITELKRIEAQLKKASTEWRVTFDSISDSIFMIDNQYQILRANKAFANTLGLSYKEIIGKKCYELIQGTDGPKEFCPHAQTLADGKEHTKEIYDPKFKRYYLITTTPILDDSGRPTSAVVIMRDITEQKVMESEILQAEKLASLGQLAAGVAHEINNPSAFVMTNLGQLNDYVSRIKEFLEKYRKLVERSKDESLIKEIQCYEKELEIDYIEKEVSNLVLESLEGMRRIKNIVSDLKIFSHSAEEEVEEVNINDIVNSAINMVRNEIKFRGTIEKELADVPTIAVVRAQIAQVILNILLNAIQALDEKKASENIVKLSTGQDKDRIFVRISDTGCGIDKDALNKIFEPFYTTKPAGIGTGLGLAICQKIMNKHRGEISVESELGKGSTFTLWFPLDKETKSISPPRQMQDEIQDEFIPQSAKILIVDDERFMLYSLSRLLEKHFEVKTAQDGYEALETLEKNQNFDLVLCDLAMPGMNGRELYLEVLRRWPGLKTKFLFFSGGAFSEELKEFANLNKDRLIPKPFQAEEILRLLNNRLKQLKNQ